MENKKQFQVLLKFDKLKQPKYSNKVNFNFENCSIEKNMNSWHYTVNIKPFCGNIYINNNFYYLILI